MVNLLTNRSFQMWTFAIAFVTGLIVLMALGALTTGSGMPLLTAVAGFMLGVPVSTTPSNG